VSRFESAANETASEQPHVTLAIAAELAFVSGALRVTDAIGTIEIGGNDFQGRGEMWSVDRVEEGIDVTSNPVELTLSGVDASLISKVTTENYQRRAANLYIVWYNPANNEPWDVPEGFWSGYMDVGRVTLGRDESSIKMRCEDSLRRASLISRYTDADQQLAYAGDRGLELVPKIPGFRGKWGEKEVLDLGQRRDAGDFFRRFADRLP
jgi:hypothetical protein